MTDGGWGGRREGAGRPKKPTSEAEARARMTLQAARAKKVIYQAELARLEFESRRREFIGADEARHVIKTLGGMLADDLADLPKWASQRLVAVDDEFAVDVELEGEIRRRLNAFVDRAGGMLS